MSRQIGAVLVEVNAHGLRAVIGHEFGQVCQTIAVEVAREPLVVLFAIIRRTGGRIVRGTAVIPRLPHKRARRISIGIIQEDFDLQRLRVPG